MSDDPQPPPPAPYPGEYVQPVPGSAPVPSSAPGPSAAPTGYGVAPSPAYGQYPPAGYGVAGHPGPPAPAAAPARSRTRGLVALIVAIAAVVISVILSASTGFAAAEGAMRHAVGISPEGLESFTEEQLLALLSPVRDLVLWAEIGYWIGTVLGLAALALGITAIATRRGRGLGISAVVIAGVGPFVYAIVVGAVVLAGVGAGAS